MGETRLRAGVRTEGVRRVAEWLDRRVTPLLFVAPFFVLFAVFGLFPLLYTAWVSLHDWHLVDGDQGFTGAANYVQLLGDPNFYNALLNTVSIFVVATVPQLLCALGIAALLDRPLRGRTAWHTAVLLPNVVSVAAVALIFAQLFGRDYGVVNWVLAAVGVSPVDWQANAWSAHLGVAVMVVWRWAGYNALLYLAAMQAVPRELYEAAEIDGASRWRSFWSVTVPGIRSTILFTVVVSTIGGLQLFAEPQLFDSSGTAGVGGNDRQFQTLAMYLYENGFGLFKAGYASAIAWVLFLLCAGFGLVNVLVLRKAIRRG
ncbi:carbohydrate ABC transporter permease [Allokutzneria oryzae]|uniref:Carbohydrate ABC transporter permease n=1 Tax=Allokutzneria oryzae TaxID=1378989 RepID=A0ABV6AAS2_9PSEU